MLSDEKPDDGNDDDNDNPGGSGSSGGYIPPSGGIGGTTGGGNRPGTVTEPTKSSPFSDILGHWAEKDITAMYERKIVSGVTDTTFEPDRAITRAEFATLMGKALNLKAANSAGFRDVAEGAWYASNVNAAAAGGLITGYDGAFRPEDLITREEMAVIIAKAYTFLGKTAEKGGIDKFADAGSISDWAKDSVDLAAAAGLISGVTESEFRPRENATRAQCVSILARLLK